jgi:D-3-phosphoglycerate dehydrogenase
MQLLKKNMSVAFSEKRRLRVFLAYTSLEFNDAWQPELFARLERSMDVVRNYGPEVLIGSDLVKAAAECDLIIGYRSTPCDAATLQAMPSLLAFLRAAVDISTIDTDEASRLGILVTRVTPGFFDSVAELGIGLMVDLARGISKHRLGLHGGYGVAPIQGCELSGSTLGFVGYGGIARRMNELAKAFGMRTVAYDPLLTEADVKLLPLNEVLSQSAFVVCLAASNMHTRHLFNDCTFSLMKRGAYFVNLSRGELVDEDALEESLESGYLAGAALDVGSAADQKPAHRFLARRDVVVTQHIGATTTQARARQTLDILAQAEAIAKGIMPHGAVNRASAQRINSYLDLTL